MFGHSATLVSGLFGVDFVYSKHAMINYMPHGIMIGAGAVSLLQCAFMLFKKGNGNATAAGKFTSSMKTLKKTLGLGYVAYFVVAMLLALITGIDDRTDAQC